MASLEIPALDSSELQFGQSAIHCEGLCEEVRTGALCGNLSQVSITWEAECSWADAVVTPDRETLMLELISSDRNRTCLLCQHISCYINRVRNQPLLLCPLDKCSDLGKYSKLLPRRAVCEDPWSQQGFSFVGEQVTRAHLVSTEVSTLWLASSHCVLKHL